MDNLRSIFREQNVIKNKVVIFIIFISITARIILDSFFGVPLNARISLGVIGYTISLLPLFLTIKYKYIKFTSYYLVIEMCIMGTVMVKGSPSLATYLIFFYILIVTTLFQDFMLSLFTIAVCSTMVTYFFFNLKDTVFKNNNMVDFVFIVGYMVFPALIFFIHSYLTKRLYKQLDEKDRNTSIAKEKVESVHKEVKTAISDLISISSNIESSNNLTDRIFSEICTAFSEVSGCVVDEDDEINSEKISIVNTQEEMFSTVMSNKNMNNISASTSDVIKNKDNNLINNLFLQMTKVTQTIHNAENLITELVESNAKVISTLVSVSNISTQNNLLSLNASIEATKAGEQDKEFAEVAEETRKMAEQSNRLTSEIKTILDDMVIRINNVTGDITKEKEFIDLSLDSTYKTKEYFNKIKDDFMHIKNRSNSVKKNMQNLQGAD
jgi:methyl-accepting chemotaxis protein